MTTVTYSIPAINCGHCVHAIKMELSDLDGVKSVEGDPAAKTVTVEYDAPATDETIRSLLNEINYPAD
ncbi:MAG: heavy-metal-associated domain-containing protein [Chloroflexi bacterium]|nr:heavy-metal-associated domain-containing protein [Chloroflexota bacterium]